MKTICCNNCNKIGHKSVQCNMPIISHGIIAFYVQPDSSVRHYLMVCRKNTFGFIDFNRDRFRPQNAADMIDEMTDSEKELIRLKFPLWSGTIDASQTHWSIPEWEFPKGRKNANEKDIECALREFEEETGILRQYINILENVMPFEELFIGSDKNIYKYRYFVAQFTYDPLNTFVGYQRSEISRLEWKTVDECLASIRPYHVEKKQLICKIDHALGQYMVV